MPEFEIRAERVADGTDAVARRRREQARFVSESLDTVLLAVFLCTTPLETPRMISCWARRSAALAASWSPDRQASLTLRTNVRIRAFRA